ncbi:MAG TPA: hypothetical protein VHU91_08630, partial [Mycobacteriales bacterium]|nr:hypothetical protein [Mycobacteriales bacterium]
SIRAGLVAVLGFLDHEPALRELVSVEALGAGPRVLERRAQLLRELTSVIEQGQAGVRPGNRLPAVIAEGVVGATLGVIHARLLEQSPEPLMELLGELMAMIVLPYRGRAAAARELSRPAAKATTVDAPDDTDAGGSRGVSVRRPLGSAPVADFRLTVRTQTVLAAVAEYPGSNNRRLSELAGISDQGQISRLMIRLQGHGLLENVGGEGQGSPKAWRLTPDGKQIVAHGLENTGNGADAWPLTERGEELIQAHRVKKQAR